MINIDGSYKEGGGQILRISIFLSLLTNKPFYIYNIRKGRPNPGLKNQHLHILKCIKEISESKVEGDRLNSLEVRFFPGKVKGGKVKIDFQTAGSIPLFLQTIFPVSLLSINPIYLELVGGTDVPGGPVFDYFRYFVLDIFDNLLKEKYFSVLKRGYYPKGGGIVKIKLHGKLDRINLEFGNGELVKIKGFLSGSKLLEDRKVLERMKDAFCKKVKSINDNFEFELNYEDSPSPGCSFLVIGIFKGRRKLAADILGKRGTPAEALGEELADKFVLFLKRGDSPDPHLADHLVPFFALYGGEVYQREPTDHFETAIWTTKHFLDFKVERKENIYRFIPL
ncbi:MAG: RNA 3'-terminal phosphate cyclase [Candidatus Hydrothermales bacterium]